MTDADTIAKQREVIRKLVEALADAHANAHGDGVRNPHAVALGKLGGQAKSERKTAAVRENAKKPRKKKSDQPVVPR